MAEREDFKTTVDSLLNGLESFLSSKTVVGEPIKIGDIIILPLVNVSQRSYRDQWGGCPSCTCGQSDWRR